MKVNTETLFTGKYGVFKSIVVGTPTPTVTWARAKGEILFHADLCVQKYDEASQEHTLEVSVPLQSDTESQLCY